ncbi:hypothetical protein EGT07_09935 [Herbaspirillum sp. HC18]|nr:hypothetical protein EGT07_09935 [Herbaspirillum sp. HC18]
MRSLFRQVFRRPAGFGLVEVMVGVAIGMLGIVIMLQVFTVSESNKRATTGGDDAQNNGAIALYVLQRELRESGYGVNASISSNAPFLFGCDVQLRAGVTLNSIGPVSINHASIPAGDPNTDTLLIVYGSAAGSPEGDLVVLQPAANTYAVATPTSFTALDWIIVQPQTRPSPCSLTMEQVASAAPNLVVPTGVAGVVNGTVFNMGQAPKIQAYAVRSGNLTVCDYMVNNCGDNSRKNDATVWVPIASNIVSLRAQYGRDTTMPAMDGIVDIYDSTTPATPCDWVRASAIRYALVARSGEYDKKEVTNAAPTWMATSPNVPAGSASAPIDISMKPDGTADPDWKHFRYRTFQTISPLRNIVSLGVQSTCGT